jgi:hypothetical protein
MRTILIAAAIAGAAAPAFASDKTELEALVAKAVVAVTPEETSAICAPDAIVIDDFAPHTWQGPNACANWAKDYGALVTKNGWKDAKVSIGKARHFQIDGATAYAVYPSTVAYTDRDGKAVSHPGNTWIMTFKKIGKTWKLSGWAWADGK